LETLLESNILLLEGKGIVVDERLKTINIKNCIDEVISYHNNLVKHNRIPFCFTFFKEVTNFCIALLETPGNEHKNVITPRISTGVIDRWPTAFQSMRPMFFNVRDRTEIGHVCDQIIRSILNVHRLCEDFKEISLESITKPGKPLNPTFKEDFRAFVKRRFSSNNIVGSLKWNTTLNIDQSKNGPNGTLSFKSSDLEALKLLNTKRFSIPFRKICELTDNLSLYEYISKRSEEQLKKFKQTFESNTNSSKFMNFQEFLKSKLEEIYLRKISGVPDTGHKSRTIAICDFWTQTILEPTERDLVQATLKLYPHSCDYYSHSKGFLKMFKRLKVGDVFYDCSNWTDRFPVELQEIVHCEMYGPNITKCWMDLVVKCPWFVQNSLQTVRYSTGQGMGTRGSFQIAQLTSCLLMDYIFVTYYKKENNGRYWAEVGDDMGCHDPDGHVLKLYKELDIPINLSKTKITTKENLCMEYVSRNVNFGHDVSRISVRSCEAVGENLLDLTSLVLHINERTKVFDFHLLFKKLIDLKTRLGNPRFKIKSWIILYKTLMVNDIIYPNEILSSMPISIKNALSDFGHSSTELELFGNIKIDLEIQTLLKLHVLDNIVNKISTAGKELEINHIKENGKPFKLIDHLFVDAIVRRSLEEGEISPFPWNLLPEVFDGCAVYHYMLAMSNQKYHKFVSELFGSGILNGKDFSLLNSEERLDLLSSLEEELTKILISVTPRQVFDKRESDYRKPRRKVSLSYGLLKYFSTPETLNQVHLKFSSELQTFKELDSKSGIILGTIVHNKPE
jgi:hypothetical protein